MSVTEFMRMFAFDPAKSYLVGVERECFLTEHGRISPIASKVLSHLNANSNGRSHCFGYELSACQLEDRVERPCELGELRSMLEMNEQDIQRAERELGFGRIHCGIAPEDVPLDHYPDPRYDKIVAAMPKEVLRAACRVAGIHVHVGMPDHDTALRVYNQVVDHFPMLCRVGCIGFDGRLDQYQVVVESLGKKVLYSERVMLFMKHLVNGAHHPPSYKNWGDFHDRAVTEGFVNDPRRLWDFVRISKHGTIEFRMFDSTDNLRQIWFWAALCLDLCRAY